MSLAELAAAGIILHAAEATAVVLEICRQYAHGGVRGIPSAAVIRLTADGGLLAEGPITTDRPPIAAAAQLLDDLLPPFDAPPPYRVPGGLRLIVARALGTLDLPPFESLDDFCRALARFAADDLAATARNLYQAWECSRAPRTLTISDLRRARRATGLSLDDVSSACGVRADLLRELEWGYLKNWRNDSVGRTWLAGYAKASGLDERVVTSIVVPMMDQQLSPESGTGLVSSGPQQLVPFAMPEQQAETDAVPVPETPPVRPSRRLRVWMIPAAAALLLLALVAAAWWPPRPAVQARADATPPVIVPEVAASDSAHVVPAVQLRPATPRASKRHSSVKRASHATEAQAPARKPASKPGFFKREILRIVLK